MPVSSSDRTTFERCVLASGLLSAAELEEARLAVGWSASDEPDSDTPPTDQQLADRLVEMGQLNAWQASQLLEGRTKFNLGPYSIVDSIGQGGMGQVFKAEHSVMGRTVAVKVLPLNKTTPDAVANFTHEIRALARLDHRRLVRALDAGHDGNVYYLVTEFVPGSDLRKLVRRDGPLDMRTGANIVFQVAEGLRHAHEKGTIHRDVKPANVLVTPDGEAKLSDLGLAGPLEGDAESDPRFGKIVGTADFISPDHIKSPWDPTPAWDIYSLGCTLYYAVTGKVPFPGGTTADKAHAHRQLRPLDPRRLNTGLSDEFVEMMSEMMAKNPVERIPSAIAVMERLAPWVDPALSAAAAAPQPPRRPGPLVVPPPIVFPSGQTSEGSFPTEPPIQAHQLRDTQPDFPDLRLEPSADDVALAPASAGSGSWANSADSPSVQAEAEIRGPRFSIVRPLVVFVGLPLVLVGVLALLLWLAQ